MIKELYGTVEHYNVMLDSDIDKLDLSLEFRQAYNVARTENGGTIESASGKIKPITATQISVLKALSIMSTELPEYYRDICMHITYYYLFKVFGNDVEVDDRIPVEIKDEILNVIEEVENESI